RDGRPQSRSGRHPPRPRRTGPREGERHAAVAGAVSPGPSGQPSRRPGGPAGRQRPGGTRAIRRQARRGDRGPARAVPGSRAIRRCAIGRVAQGACATAGPARAGAAPRARAPTPRGCRRTARPGRSRVRPQSSREARAMNPLSAMPLPVPELAPGPQAGSGKGDGESGDGFADVLQRATGHRQSDSAKGTREDRAGSARAKPAGTESAMEEPPGAADAVAPEGGPARARPERLSRERERAQAEVPMIPLGLAPGPMPAPSPVVAEATTPELGDTPDADLGDALAAGRAAPARPGDATRRTFGPAGEIAGEDARDDGDGRMADASSPVDAEAAATPPGRVATTPATPPEPGTGAAAGALEGVGRATRRPTAAGRTGPRLAATDAAARGGPALPAAPAPTEVQAMSARASMALEPSGHTPGIEGPTGASASGDIATATPGVPASPANPGAPRAVALPVAAPVFSPAFPQALGQQLVMALRMDLDQAELILSP